MLELRIIFFSIIYFFVFFKIRKYKNSRVLIIILSVIVFVSCLISYFITFENLFITFSSPQKSYKYSYSNDVDFIVEGIDTDFVVSFEEANKNNFLIIPKNEDGWKIGRGIDTKFIKVKTIDKYLIQVYRYKNSNDYYILVEDSLSKKTLSVSDNRDSDVKCLERKITGNRMACAYFIYVNILDEDYKLFVDGQSINIMDDVGDIPLPLIH